MEIYEATSYGVRALCRWRDASYCEEWHKQIRNPTNGGLRTRVHHAVHYRQCPGIRISFNADNW